jgi:hypothetical protein
MERSVKILILIFLYLLFSSRSCDDDPAEQAWQQHQAELVKDSIRAEFQTEDLPEPSLRAAEMNAMRKLSDLADYVEIFSDVSMDPIFRDKAEDMIRDMFISEDDRLSFGPVKKEKMKQVTVKEFLEEGFGPDIIKTEIHFDTLRVVEPLQKTGEEIYSGKLATNQIIIAYHESDSLITPALPITVEFISSRKHKIIGRDTLQVWELKLGDMQ